MKKNIIVLGADSNYKRQVLTTIKSICYHNRNIKFYLLNKDIDEEWIADINHKLQKIDCEIEDVKIVNDEIETFHTYSHISSATYFRYFIPEKIKENRLLYLDSDLIVTGSLDYLFHLDMKSCPVAGVSDMICEFQSSQLTEFNAGVMIIDNQLWRAEDLLKKSMAIHLTNDGELRSADQSVLNIIFKDRWLRINKSYNFQVGVGYLKELNNLDCRLDFPIKPIIIHYTTKNKPWKKVAFSRRKKLKLLLQAKFKEFLKGEFIPEYNDLWFYYDSLTFEEITTKEIDIKNS